MHTHRIFFDQQPMADSSSSVGALAPLNSADGLKQGMPLRFTFKAIQMNFNHCD
jgi:hypothetical protein